MISDAKPALALTTNRILTRIEPLLNQTVGINKLPLAAIEAIENDLAAKWVAPIVGNDTLAFLQYTSGSTAKPKGVMISHGNLLHNEQMIQNAFQQSEHSIIVGWLPLFHDMGLIGNVLQPLYAGARCILLSPEMFLREPLLWLETISSYQATTSGGPNFAYDLCIRRLRSGKKLELDLSSWSVAFNGAEPIHKDTLDRFASAFAPYGFRREAFYPC